MRIEWSTKLKIGIQAERKSEYAKLMALLSYVKKLAEFYKVESEEINLMETTYNNYKCHCLKWRSGSLFELIKAKSSSFTRVTECNNFLRLKSEEELYELSRNGMYLGTVKRNNLH